MENEKKLLSWFLGPKSENATFLEEALLLILRDYFHWRRNYFPGDSILISRQLQRDLETQYDLIHQNLLELLAELRRNFPFYSPRYIAHMLSDTVITSILGYVAGLMYNPNNVTPEAAPVTVNMEIRACNALLKMLGFNPPPEIPKDLSETSIKNYKRKLEAQFGWAHLTLGGTTANLEALWVARSVKYSPLAIRDVATREGLEIDVKLPNGEPRDLREANERQLLLIKPNEAIYLLARYVHSYRLKHGIPIHEASERAYDLLKSSPYHLNNGVAELFSRFPPVIFVSGTKHYSIDKAADILGIGRGNIRLVYMDSSFRMDISDLEKKIQHALSQKEIPLAVIPIVGTTEEGAVDPVHSIVDLRDKLEKQKNVSFWIHVDAAWGGYIRALFNLSVEDEIRVILSRISRKLGIEFTSIQGWHKSFFEYVEQRFEHYVSGRLEGVESTNRQKETIKDKKRKISSWKAQLDAILQSDDLVKYMRDLRRFVREHDYMDLDIDDFDLKLQHRIELVNEHVSETMHLHHDRYSKELLIKWGSKEVCSALVAVGKADSVTIDPHKMGYVNYPSGMVAFRNDRVRHFILEKAPYITSVRQDILVHMPPEHIEGIEDNPRIFTEAFAPFIVEGSRPGAAASALWLTVKTIAPTMTEAGLIVKSSLLAARELYEWLVHWEKIMRYNQKDTDYLFVPFTLHPPDTNIVIFGVKKKTSTSLSKMNEVTRLVYEKLTIQAELGDRDYSYAQPFFLSKTEFRQKEYRFDTLKPLFMRCFKSHLGRISDEYKSEGLVVLRATVMNPYLWLTGHISAHNLLEEFMQELAKAACESVQSLM